MSNTFDNLINEQQKEWWLGQAKKALASFDMENASIEWLAYTHNAVFKVRFNNAKYILRLSLPENSEQVSEEYHLLRGISNAGLAVSRPIEVLFNEHFSAILLHYQEGRSLSPNDVTENDMRKIGQFLGRFHNTEIPETIYRTALDWEGLFSETGAYYPGENNMSVFKPVQLAIMDAVAKTVKSAMDKLGKSKDEFGLIHGDLLLKNILFHHGKVHALDFEYSGLGYYLYDLTPILWQLKPQSRYLQLEQSLWDSYASIRPMTKRHRDLLETFIAGRQVASMRWIAANQKNPYVEGKVDEILHQRTAELSAFLETGELKRE